MEADRLAEYGEGMAISQMFLQYQRRLPYLQSFPDIEILTNGECLIPNESLYTWGVIPKDYFSTLLPQIHSDWTSSFIKYLFGWHKYSIKSKIAQSGLKIEPTFPSQRSYLALPVEEIGNDFIAPFTLKNINPYKEIKLPTGLFPMLRLFTESPYLEGSQLVEAVKRVGLENPRFMNWRGEIYTQKEVDKLSWHSDQLFYGAVGNLAHVVLDIVKEAEFASDGIGIDLSILPYISSKDRGILDQVLGLKWGRQYLPSSVGHRIWIGETQPVSFPPDLAAVINSQIQLTNIDSAHHLKSPLIDPGFGSDIKGGLPIRVEIETMGMGDYQREVFMSFYKTKSLSPY